MNQLKQRSKLPALVTLLVVGLTMVYGDTQHLCHLHSTIVEIPLLLGVVLGCYLWTARAKTSGQAWLRTGLAFVLAIAIEMTYLFWLHSDFFPRALLSRTPSNARQNWTDCGKPNAAENLLGVTSRRPLLRSDVAPLLRYLNRLPR